jgi:beta-N-acetylhexosaminidase
MAGQRVIYSYTGLEPPATLLNWIRHGQVGGVIFFGGNISSRAQIASVISELNQANASPLNPMRAFPLLLMTDQEGGLVRRLPGQPLRWESPPLLRRPRFPPAPAPGRTWPASA